MTMAFAIDEINKNTNLLPNVTLGYSMYDNCATLVIGFSAAFSLASGREAQFLLQETCLGTPPVLGIVGDSFSTFSIATSDVIGLFKLPIVRFLFPAFNVLYLNEFQMLKWYDLTCIVSYIEVIQQIVYLVSSDLFMFVKIAQTTSVFLLYEKQNLSCILCLFF